jgi:hypothetical protein
MLASDPFTRHHAPLLEGTYDLPDRIVLNAYFRLGGSGGGFVYWWKQLRGTTEHLTNSAIVEMAGRFARRVRGWTKKHNVPLIYCKSGERKSRLAEQHRPKDPAFKGVFAVLVNKASAAIWTVLRFPSGGFHVKRPKCLPHIYHYSFHIVDPEWGHVTIRMSGYPPFPAKVMLNAHEYVACRANKKSIRFSKDGNCFTEMSDPVAFARIAASLRSPSAVGCLRRVCERWIYRCTCFGLPFDQQKRSDFRYSYSVYQAEYSRNLLFHNGNRMEEAFNGVLDRTRSHLDIRQIKTIFGIRQRRIYRTGGPLRCESILDTPAFDLTVFKLHFGYLTVKIYTKGECVLRTEAITHNAKALKCGCVLEKLPVILGKLAELLDRFLAAVHGINVAWINNRTLEELPLPSIVGTTRVGGVDINKPRIRAAMEAVMALAPMPGGFTASDHARQVRDSAQLADEQYSPRQSAYDLKKLRAKGLVLKIGGQGRRYEATGDGLRSMAALVVLREKVLKPLLTYNGRCKPGSKPEATAKIDAQYQVIQREMQHLFKALQLVC